MCGTWAYGSAKRGGQLSTSLCCIWTEYANDMHVRIVCYYCVFALKIWQYGTISIDLSYGVMFMWKFETRNLLSFFFNVLRILVKTHEI